MDQKIIEEMLSLEQAAKRLLKKAEEERLDLPQKIKKAQMEINAGIDRKTQTQTAEIYARAREDTQKDTEALEQLAREREAAMRADFEQNRESWEEEIFQRVLGG